MTLPAEKIVKINDILDDDRYRISKPVKTDILEQSLRNLGMLEIPVLIESGTGFIPFTCHNRISILKHIGLNELTVLVLGKPDYNIFLRNTALKAGRGELGPAGKARALILAAGFFGISDLKYFCRNVLNASGDLLNRGFAESITGLPAVLIDYIDSRDIGFKVIKDLLVLPPEIISTLSLWVGRIQVRVNIFKMLVDCLFDMRNTVNPGQLPVLDGEDKPDDRTLLDIIYRMRYPRYSEIMDQAESIISGISFPGVAVDFPDYFEKDSCGLKIDIRSSDTAEDIRKKLSKIDAAGLEQLVSLLK